MSAAGEDEVEYESDPEETKRSLVMRRRRAASDDEESEGEVDRDREGSNRGGRIRSDESDGQGGVADYDEDEEELEEEVEEYDEEEEVYDEEEEGVNEHVDGHIVRSESVGGGAGGGGTALEEKVEVPAHLEDDGGKHVDGFADDLPLDQGGEPEKKENEPYAVPTAGAFYMHDDRFRDNAGGRHRRTFGGRKLWESKDDRKWGHDKFEEMTMQERRYDERRRTSRGRYRGRGRSRAADRGYVRGIKGENLDNGGHVGSGTTNNNSRLTHVPASVRGRGPRRYGSSFKRTNQAIPSQTKQSAKPLEKTTHDNSGKALKAASNVESDTAPARKNAFASSLNSASPPFYPSTSSSKDIAFSQNKDSQAGVSNQSFRPSSGEKLSVPQSNALLRGQNVANSIGMEKLRIEDSVSASVGKSITPLQAGPSGTSVNSQSPQVIVPGSCPAIRSGQMPYQQTLPQDLVNRLSLPMQVHGSRGSFAANKVQSPVQGSFQKFGQRPSSGSQASPPKAAVSVNSYEAGETESPSDFGKSKGALGGKSKGNMQGSGRSSFPYGNANVVGAGGNVGIGHGDQNFPATPAFLPVMHFGGQHPGGVGVPTVGMAFPGYVAQPQLGVGNSEMTWLPVLASAAGALGAPYCSPYIGMDGNYHASPSGQTTSMGSSSKESHIDIPNSDLKPSQRPEVVSEEHGQRQNKSRRYSEMNFGQ